MHFCKIRSLEIQMMPIGIAPRYGNPCWTWYGPMWNRIRRKHRIFLWSYVSANVGVWYYLPMPIQVLCGAKLQKDEPKENQYLQQKTHFAKRGWDKNNKFLCLWFQLPIALRSLKQGHTLKRTLLPLMLKCWTLLCKKVDQISSSWQVWHD